MKMHIISNTHWDREHRHSFPVTQFMLTDLMDELIEIMEKDENYKYFTLDGQSIMLDDYLEVKPQMKERLEKLIKDGRILIGPWYSLVDCYSVNEESIVRNLLTGYTKCNGISAPMKVGYSIFSFGQIAQLPQIYNGFGIDKIVFYKGANTKVFPQSEFIWYAPDGSAALTSRLGKNKRWNFSFLFTMPVIFGGTPMKPGWNSSFKSDKKLCHLIDEKNKDLYADEKEPTRVIDPSKIPEAIDDLIADTNESLSDNFRIGFDGTDFIPATKEIPKAIEIANGMQDKLELVHSNPELYFADLESDIDIEKLQKYSGELRFGPIEHLHSETMGSNIEIKIADFNAENKLIGTIEPLNVFSLLSGSEYNKEKIDFVWKNLFKTHAHDSIHGSGDPHIKTDNLNRLEQIEEMEGYLLKEAAGNVCSNINVKGLADDESGIVVFNTCRYEKDEVLTLFVDLPAEDIPSNPVLFDGDKKVEIYYRGREDFTMAMINRSNRPKGVKSVRIKLVALVKNIPAMGYKMLKLRWDKGDPSKIPNPFPPGVFPYNPIGKGDSVLDNGLLRVEANNDGTINVYDYETKKSYKDMHYFTDSACSGDFWVHREPEDSIQYSSKSAQTEFGITDNSGLKATLVIKKTMQVADGLTFDRKAQSTDMKPLTITSKITLSKGSKTLEFKTEIENNSSGHLLNLVIPTGIDCDEVLCDAPFEVLKRPIDKFTDEDGRRGPELLRFAVQNFADLSDKDGGVTLVTKGNKEMFIEKDQGCSFNVTMIRSVKGTFPVQDDCFLSFENENADCKGLIKTEYALCFHNAKEDVIAKTKKYLCNTLAMQVGHGSQGDLPETMSFAGSDFEIACLKREEIGNRVVMRVYNPTDTQKDGYVSLYGAKKAYLATMGEEIVEELPMNDSKTELKLEAYKIKTIIFEC